jgi:N-formylglutamate deformylase
MSFTLQRGTTPLIISMPHVGQQIPDDVRDRFVARALQVEDTDWFLDRLYAFAADLGASLLVPNESRYVIDLNRPTDNTPMYTGVNTTELCPTRFFTGEPLYRDGQEPDGSEILRRVEAHWQPYHDALADELGRVRGAHGHAVLFDAHSIKSELPWLFEGTLPHLNLGTVDGRSCAPSLRQALIATMAGQQHFTHVTDGRFKGGHITRHYGRPKDGVHAVQLEMCWRSYMDEGPPPAWNDARAAKVTPLLRKLVQTLMGWRAG